MKIEEDALDESAGEQQIVLDVRPQSQPGGESKSRRSTGPMNSEKLEAGRKHSLTSQHDEESVPSQAILPMYRSQGNTADGAGEAESPISEI